MPTYQLIRKHIYRASLYDIQMGVKPDGSPNMVRQNGPLRRIEVGQLLDDLTPEELAGMQDRLVLIPEDQVEQVRALVADPTFRPEAGAHEPMSGPGDKVQKPPLSPEQAETMKEAEAELQKVENELAVEQQEMDRKRQETRNQAFERAHEKAVARMTGKQQEQQQEQQQRQEQQRREAEQRTTETPPPATPQQRQVAEEQRHQAAQQAEQQRHQAEQQARQTPPAQPSGTPPRRG